MQPTEITRETLPDLHKRTGHKFDHGHALVLSGGTGRTGAARLVARAALRVGAGLVTLGCPRSAMFENAAHLTAIMLRQIDGGHGLEELMEDTRISALCLGPGLGLQADTQALVVTALRIVRPTVLDADGLSRFQAKPDVLLDALHAGCVITPHMGEFTRLFPDIAARLGAEAAVRGDEAADRAARAARLEAKIGATQEAAARAGCIVLLKGVETVIAAPDGRCLYHAAVGARAAPWLATAGTGDVLAGFITGLIARGHDPMDAAAAATWLHVECARFFGPGLISEDLPEVLPEVFRSLL